MRGIRLLTALIAFGISGCFSLDARKGKIGGIPVTYSSSPEAKDETYQVTVKRYGQKTSFILQVEQNPPDTTLVGFSFFGNRGMLLQYSESKGLTAEVEPYFRLPIGLDTFFSGYQLAFWPSEKLRPFLEPDGFKIVENCSVEGCRRAIRKGSELRAEVELPAVSGSRIPSTVIVPRDGLSITWEPLTEASAKNQKS